MGMACFHPLVRGFFPKTRSRLLIELLNIASQASHHQSLKLPGNEVASGEAKESKQRERRRKSTIAALD